MRSASSRRQGWGAKVARALPASLLVLLSSVSVAAAKAPPLRVCADPNNMPFSNNREEGFENRIATMLAAELQRPLTYTWRPQRRGFIRNTLEAGVCDLVIGAPSSLEMAQTTQPYYRSTYVFVTRTEDQLAIRSFDDSQLRELLVGVHVIGDDYSNAPPAHALSMRGVVQNVRGYSIYGDYSRPDPPRDLLDALVKGEIDVAIAWGPLAGYYAQHAPIPLQLTPVSPTQVGVLPMTFEISMAMRRDEPALRRAVEHFLARRGDDLEAVLESYGVPLLPRSSHASAQEERELKLSELVTR